MPEKHIKRDILTGMTWIALAIMNLSLGADTGDPMPAISGIVLFFSAPLWFMETPK